jgi:hypothetical protein
VSLATRDADPASAPAWHADPAGHPIHRGGFEARGAE